MAPEDLEPCAPPPCPPVEEAALSGLAVAGGWCAPSSGVYSLADHARIALPEVTAPRGGFTYEPPTAAARAANDALRARAARVAEDMTAWRHQVVEEACAVALANGWDVHLYHHPRYGWTRPLDPEDFRVTGRISLQFRPAKHSIPTIVEHRDVDATWDDDEDWSEA